MLYSESESDDEAQSDYEVNCESYDTYSLQSGISKDNESFHTAIDSESDDEVEIDSYSAADDYSILSRIDGMSEGILGY
jgi:hypothetical protein